MAEMAEKKLQPIIIKRVKKGGHAVHGGAWKIAYADFVTAMMAFFLLMWLLGSTAKGDCRALPTISAAPLKVAMMVAMARATAPASSLAAATTFDQGAWPGAPLDST
jgi:flagellar motor protein MotB